LPGCLFADRFFHPQLDVFGMSWKPSARLIQMLVGMSLVAVCGYFLWKNTLQPVAQKLQRGESLGGSFREALKQSARYQSLQRHAEELAREREKAKLESLKAEREGRGSTPPGGEPAKPDPGLAPNEPTAPTKQAPNAP
jgi:hypothetical protein